MECDNCGSKKVVKNVQLSWVEYDFDNKTQEYSKEPVMIYDPVDNFHYCNKCFKKWENDDLN